MNEEGVVYQLCGWGVVREREMDEVRMAGTR